MREFATAVRLSMLWLWSSVGCRTYVTSDILVVNGTLTIDILSPRDGDAYIENDVISFRMRLSDDEYNYGDLDVFLNSSIDGALESQIEWRTEGSVYEGSSILSVGEHSLTFGVQDTDGTQSLDKIHLVVLSNAAPTCGVMELSHGLSVDGQSVLFTGFFYDVDNPFTDLNIQWSSSLQEDGMTSMGSSTGGTQWQTDELLVGVHEIVLTITDPYGKSCQDSVQHIVVSESERGLYDVDGDGLVGDLDCDDDDASVLDGPNGAVEQCPSSSCLDILTEGYSQGDGVYWVLDDNDTVTQVYCEMTTYSGGWALCGSMADMDVGVAYGFEDVGEPSVSTMYSRNCLDELQTIGTEVLATVSTLNEMQVWTVTDSYLRGINGTAIVPAVTPVFDSRGLYTETVSHGVCNFGNCTDATNGYTIGTKIGTMLNGNYHAFGLGAHCDQECNEALVWYNEIVTGRVNFFVR